MSIFGTSNLSFIEKFTDNQEFVDQVNDYKKNSNKAQRKARRAQNKADRQARRLRNGGSRVGNFLNNLFGGAVNKINDFSDDIELPTVKTEVQAGSSVTFIALFLGLILLLIFKPFK